MLRLSVATSRWASEGRMCGRDEVGGGGASGCDADDVRVHKRCDGWIESAGVTPRA